MRFRPAPLSFWANVITVGMVGPLILFVWMGLRQGSSTAFFFYGLALIWAILIVLCWAAAVKEYRIVGTTLVITRRFGGSRTYELVGLDEVAMKRQPLRRAFAFQAIGTYGPFGFHGRYRVSIMRPATTPSGRPQRRREEFDVACTTLQKAIYLRTKIGTVVVSPQQMTEMLAACNVNRKEEQQLGRGASDS